MPQPTPALAALTRITADLAVVRAEVERAGELRALAEAVLAYDADGLSDLHRPAWAALVQQARAALEN